MSAPSAGPPVRPPEGPPYRVALLVGLITLAGYVISLAPGVTFWDAGELIASMKILGIPHPPGTPLFVMMGHVWGTLVPVGEFAFRTNLMSAAFSAGAAACWFLVLQEAAGRYLRDEEAAARGRLHLAAAAAGVLIAAFGFTNWQSSNETEVYAVATFTTAAVSWLLFRWRAARGTPRAARYLLLVAYLLGIAIGNHLLGLLVGPAAVAFVVAELRLRPASDPAERRRDWGDAAVLAGLWALLTGIGLGSSTLILFGAAAFLAALLFAAAAGEAVFGLLMLGIALIGVTPYLFLYLRSAQLPMINEAAPATWDALLAVIRRSQYPPRTPLDDPTEFSGADNPGRTLTLIGLQLLNYLQYFDWQWARTLPGGERGGLLPVRTLFTLVFLALGWRGFLVQWRSDRSGAWMMLVLWLATGLGLVGYMNFKPGYSVGYGQYPDGDDHEVRERDYFFILSFVVWGLWAGLGLLAVVRGILKRIRGRADGPPGRAGVLLPRAVFLLALVPFALNFQQASRRHIPDARLAGDFAYDLLNSVPPYGVLFTYGDNDTFPLWWAQEVAGIRRDVTVVCLALAETDWYMRQLRDNPVRPFDESAAPAVWKGLSPVAPTWPLHTMTDEEITRAIPQILPREVQLPVGRHQTTLPANSVLYGKDFLAIRVIQQNFGRRPIVWGLTAAGNSYGLERFLLQRGIGIELMPEPVDSMDLRYDYRKMMGAPLDLAATERLLMDTYRYADLLNQDTRRELETTASGIAGTLGLPFTQMATAMETRGDTARTIRFLERAALLSRNPAIAGLLEELRRGLRPAAPDSK